MCARERERERAGRGEARNENSKLRRETPTAVVAHSAKNAQLQAMATPPSDVIHLGKLQTLARATSAIVIPKTRDQKAFLTFCYQPMGIMALPFWARPSQDDRAWYLRNFMQGDPMAALMDQMTADWNANPDPRARIHALRSATDPQERYCMAQSIGFCATDDELRGYAGCLVEASLKDPDDAVRMAASRALGPRVGPGWPRARSSRH